MRSGSDSRGAAAADRLQTIAVASGKGGVGKSTVSLNLALSLQRSQRRVMLMDADLGLANIDVLLGLQPTRTMRQVLDGECSLAEAVTRGPDGLMVLPAASGDAGMAALGAAQRGELIRGCSEIRDPVDHLIVDVPAGISPDVMSFSRAAQHVVVVVCDEPASLTDAYGLIKVLRQTQRVQRFRILANRTRTAAHGRQLFRRLAIVADRFLDVSLDYLGAIPEDPRLQQAVQQQRAVVEAAPGSPSARAFGELADRVGRWAPARRPSGHTEFFLDRLVKASGADRELAA